jgi:hypothetical protein
MGWAKFWAIFLQTHLVTLLKSIFFTHSNSISPSTFALNMKSEKKNNFRAVCICSEKTFQTSEYIRTKSSVSSALSSITILTPLYMVNISTTNVIDFPRLQFVRETVPKIL